ncbi:MAG TPA: histidine kinase dimerization/phospho-acceptor domain-containing protein [Kofleriaceae bacterium]
MMADPVTLSREFRTLVAAIRGPLDEELADRNASAARRERIKTLQRNFMRLLQLVNTLFDLSQSEVQHVGPELVDSTATTLVIPTLRDGEFAAAHHSPPDEVDED